MRRAERLAALAMVASIATAACVDDPSLSSPDTQVVVETVGDTTVVRTLAGSEWRAEASLVPEVSIGALDGAEEYTFGGVWSIAVDADRRVYVFDGQAQHVRVFDSAGAYVETLGGRGEGPGEFSRAEAISVLPDGRLVVRDPGNTRIQTFGPRPGEMEEWTYEVAGLYSSSPLYTDSRGRTFLHTSDLSRDDFAMHVIVLGPDGTHVDTLPEPSSTYEPPIVRAEFGGGSSATYIVPFSPAFVWTVHSSGHFITGLPTEYRIELARDDGVLRIERVTDAAPVHDEERAQERERIVSRMRGMDPDWTWNGPDIPDRKPFFAELLAGRDGRIWVRLASEARPVQNAYPDPDDTSPAAVLWRDPVRYDVFEPDGTYLGVVATPEAFSPSPDPIFDREHVWAVTRDGLGVERVVRYRIVVGDGRERATTGES